METFKHIRNEKNTFGASLKTNWGQPNTNTFNRAGTSWLVSPIYLATDAADALLNLNSKEFVITYVRWGIHIRNTSNRSMPFTSYTGRFKNFHPSVNFPSNAFTKHLVPTQTNATSTTSNGYQVYFYPNRDLLPGVDCKYDIFNVHQQSLSRSAPNGGNWDQALFTMDCKVDCSVVVKDAAFTAGNELSFETDTFGECPFLALAAWADSIADSTSNAAITCQFWYYEPPGVEKLFTV